MEFGTMMGLLLSGLQFTAIIFVITLVGMNCISQICCLNVALIFDLR